jgi:hypothetical protein
MPGVFHATEKDTMQHGCGSVIVVLISLWKLLAYLLYVTQRFVLRIISYTNVVYFVVGNCNGHPSPKLLRRRAYGAAQGRKRKTLQVSKESNELCS